MPDIKTILNSFSKLNVLIVGDVMVDEYIWGSVDRISPEAPVPVVKVHQREYRLGGAANVALNILALGARPFVCSLCGDDPEGKRLAELLKSMGMSAKGIVTSSARPTTMKTRVIASHQHVVRIDAESDAGTTKEEEDSLLARIEELAPECQVIIFEDYDKGSLSPGVIRKTIELAGRHKVPTVVDPKKRNFLAYREATLFKPNLKELREGLKMEVDVTRADSVRDAVRAVREELSVKGVLLTLSEGGVYMNMDGTEAAFPAHAREIADVSGAGDTVVAVAALALASGLTPKSIAKLSNLAGGLVCQHVGVVPIDRTELEAEASKSTF